MIRMFRTHHIRRQRELSGLWRYRALEGPKAGETVSTMVPGCWESMPGYETYRGEAEYETTLWAGGNIRLDFQGVSHTASVYLDGKLLGRHYNAYTPFSLLATEMPAGLHTLVVRVSNAFGPKSALHVPNDYYRAYSTA